MTASVQTVTASVQTVTASVHTDALLHGFAEALRLERRGDRAAHECEGDLGVGELVAALLGQAQLVAEVEAGVELGHCVHDGATLRRVSTSGAGGSASRWFEQRSAHPASSAAGDGGGLVAAR